LIAIADVVDSGVMPTARRRGRGRSAAGVEARPGAGHDLHRIPGTRRDGPSGPENEAQV
jgi:hypothetical protein